MQDSITQAIVGQLALTLGAPSSPPRAAGRTASLEAHDRYLQGLSLVHQSTEPSLRSALDHFQAALALDPAYSQPYVGIAWALRLYLADAYMLPSVAYDSAEIAARKAIDLGRLDGGGVHRPRVRAVTCAPGTRALVAERHAPGHGPEPAIRPTSARSTATGCVSPARSDAGRRRGGPSQPRSTASRPLGGFVREWCLYVGRWSRTT